ncbi:MAG: hypothetical protein DRG40_00685 [Deltaproteobacteria bacterium]|nr:MAG: hypothetical protein DRG40_00685 [Deltaproteobacteria bacterium]
MEVFPQNIIYPYPIEVEEIWKTLITDFESGKEQRRRRWAFPKRKVRIKFSPLQETEARTLWEFYHARQGAFEAFWFVWPYADRWTDEYVGTGDGSTTTWDLPSVDTDPDTVQVYVDGLSVSFTFLEGGGQAGADRVQLAVAPEEGEVVTADFEGKLRIKARFAADNLTKELFKYAAWTIGVEILEVKP